MQHKNLHAYLFRGISARLTSVFSIFRILSALAIAAMLLGMHPPPVAHAANITVCASGCTYTSIQAAINAASPGDTITLAAETYTEAGITVDKDLTISGTGEGSAIVQAAASPGTATDRVFKINSGVTATLEKMTIRYGNVSDDGGGIYNQSDNLTLSNLTFSSNIADNLGGGMYNDNSSPTLSNLTFSSNTAGDGGGMFNANSSSPTLSNVTFSSNSANYSGGGMYNYNRSNPTLSNVTFSSNTAGDGGGMYNYNRSNPTLSNVTFSSNSAANYGGGMFNDYKSRPTLSNVTFSSNSAGSGGGMYNYNGRPTLSNVTFSSNTAGNFGGGGMFNDNSNPTLSNVTFSDNSAANFGGGMFNYNSSNPTLENVILWGNSAATGAEIYNISSTPTITDSVVAGSGGSSSWDGSLGTDGGGNIDADPKLGALANNGGATKTMALGAGSSAIDAGGVTTTCASTDQRGVTRPQGAACDIGAYEAGAAILTVTSTAPTSGATLISLTSIEVNFSEDALSDGSNKAANNPVNYILVEAGTNGTFDTQSCAGGVISDDIDQTISAASYANNGGAGPFTATLSLASPLSAGEYRLFICGTTSIWSAARLELNNGLNDTSVDFTVQATTTTTASSLPKTGFRHGRTTLLPEQPAAKAYTATAMTLEIPKLGVSMPIVGVPQTENGWDVSWLGNSAGYLAGSAFPTWAGNTVITGHVWDAYNRPGAFAEIKSLKYGDQIQIQAWGQTYTYEVRESKLLTKKNVNAAFQSEQYDWVTLVTCEFYNPFSGEYLFRRAVRAVLVSVE